MRLGFLGFGYTAQALAQSLSPDKFDMYATCRNVKLKQPTTPAFITLLDFNQSHVHDLFETCDALLISIPPDAKGRDPVLHALNPGMLKNTSHVRWVAYLSSTGVYGDHQGAWVTEHSVPIRPGQAGQNRLRAEKAWMSWYEAYGLPIHIFRLAGIYGPNRSSLDKLIAKRHYTIYKPEQCFSRVHVLDIVQALICSLSNPTPGELFNVCDDLPAPVHEVDAFAATLLGKPPLKRIPYEQAGLSPMGLEFFQSNKRVSNEKLKHRLLWKPLYSSYQEGLQYLYDTYFNSNQ